MNVGLLRGLPGYPAAQPVDQRRILLPQIELDYAESRDAGYIYATTEATATKIVAARPLYLDGATTIIVEASCVTFTSQSTNVPLLWLYDGETSLGRLVDSRMNVGAGNDGRYSCFARRRLTPTGGVHSYSVRGSDGGTSATPTSNAEGGIGGPGQVMPAYIRIERVV